MDVVSISQIPLFYHVLSPTREQARAVTRGDIQLVYCQQCGHLFNRDFSPELLEYRQNYENSLHFSKHFQENITRLAASLVDKYRLHNKKIIEIGCGQGDFLNLLCDLGQNEGTGYDPSYQPVLGSQNPRVRIIADYYSEQYGGQPVDFLCCRQVLEHIYHPAQFIQMVRKNLPVGQQPVVFFDVPNAAYTVDDLGIWDILYEHYSYFSKYSIQRLFAEQGFQVLETNPAFENQFLTIEAIPEIAPDKSVWESQEYLNGLDRYTQAVSGFAGDYRQKIGLWQQRIDQLRRDRCKAVVWGAGTKGVSLLNVLDTEDVITHVVDINPRKNGMYVAGSGQHIVTPDFLQSNPVDVIIVMNPNYLNEIRETLHQMGINASLVSA